LEGSTWRIRYGDNSGASGLVYTETVTVGDVTATRQAVEAATSVSAAFLQDDANDGLLGLAFSKLNQVRPRAQSTFFDSVKDDLEQPIFTCTLKQAAPGKYDFVWIDHDQYEGEIVYTPVDSAEGHWQFETTAAEINNKSISLSIDTIADTGTSLWYLPPNVVAAYYDQVEGAQLDILQGGYTFPCDTELPDISVTIGGAKRTVAGKYIKYAPTDPQNCFGGIQDNTGMPFSIFGDVFLKSQFAVFDAGTDGEPRIGFAQQK